MKKKNKMNKTRKEKEMDKKIWFYHGPIKTYFLGYDI